MNDDKDDDLKVIHVFYHHHHHHQGITQLILSLIREDIELP